MYFIQSLLVFASLSRIVLSDPYTISLGDISTYAVTVTTSGDLTGTTLSLQIPPSATSVAISQSGVYFVLSPDLQSTINSILVGPDCGTKVNSACTQALTQAFDNASLDIQSRQLQVIPLILLGLVLAEIAAEISLALGIFKPSEGIHLPPDQLNQMVAAATATEIAFASGTNALHASITPPPAPTTTPQISISTATVSANGQTPGDITISIPPSLASRIQEIIARESCFGLSKRTGDISNAICGGQALVFESQPAGSLFELQFVQGIANGNPFNLQWATDTLNDGASQVIEYAQSMAPVLRLGAAGAAALGAFAFALALVQDVDSQNINSLNIIPATAIDTTTTTSACAVTSCFAGCDMTGAIQECSTTCSTISASSNCNTSPTITTTAFLNVQTGPIQSTTCSVISTLFPLSLQSIAGVYGTQYFYTCGPLMVGINLAVSGTSTISYPALGEPPRPGFTQIPASNGHPVVATSTPPPLPHSATAPMSTANLPGTPSAKATPTYCDPYWCGAPFCGPCPTQAGSANGVIHKD